MEMFILGCKYPGLRKNFKSPQSQRGPAAAFWRDLRACLLNLGVSIQSALLLAASYLRLADMNIRAYARKLRRDKFSHHIHGSAARGLSAKELDRIIRRGMRPLAR